MYMEKTPERDAVDLFLDDGDEATSNLTRAYLGVPTQTKKHTKTFAKTFVTVVLVAAIFFGGVLVGRIGEGQSDNSSESFQVFDDEAIVDEKNDSLDTLDNETTLKGFRDGDFDYPDQEDFDDPADTTTEKDRVRMEEEIADHEAALQILEEDDKDEGVEYDDDFVGLSYDLPDFRRNLMAGGMSYNHPISCNGDLDTVTCSNLSSQSITAGQVFEVPCNTCYKVDTTDGSTLNFPDGLSIKGKLLFPSTSNVVVRTKFVLVFGLLKIDPPSSGNKVKFSLHTDDQYTATHPDSMSTCTNGCNIGSKAIAVLGGKLDIQGYNSACPTWEKLENLVPTLDRPYDLPTNGTHQLDITISGACVESAGHTTSTGKYVVRCPIEQNVTIPTGTKDRVRFTSAEPRKAEDSVSPSPAGQSLVTDGVHHWAWHGKDLYFFPEDMTDEEVSAMFPVGYRIQASYVEPQYKKIVVSPGAVSCWGTGTEILLTSHTRYSEDKQVATVIDSDPTTGVLTLDQFIEKPITVADNETFAVEVASLNRPVIFEADSDTDTSSGLNIGGHLIIHHTQTAQHLEGVEIRNFGQAGRLGRYPVHFHMCNDSPDSIVKRNVVRNSNQRGYVIHMTNEVTLQSNIAHDIIGHCYFLEAGTEIGVTFDGNLGAGITKMGAAQVGKLSQSSGRDETDAESAVFWISNPNNTYTNNMVAGSEHFGYWFETHGENENLNVQKFENNTAHSCKNFAFSTYPPKWHPSDLNYIDNLKIYRNSHWGAFLHVTRNLYFRKGLFADNGERAVMINRGDNITFEGTTFIGVTPFAEKHKACWGGLIGVSLLPHKFQEFDYSATVRGATFIDTEFYNWTDDVTGCANSIETRFFTEQVFTPSYRASHYFENVKLDHVGPSVDACRMKDLLGIDETIIEISQDSHNAYSSSGTPGFLASPRMKTMLDANACTSYNRCLDFCPNTCFRTLTVHADPSRENIKMTVTDTTDNTKTIVIDPVLRKDDKRSAQFDAHYTVSLPSGNYKISFHDANDNLVWPGYTRPVFETPPTCANYITEDNLTFNKPPADRSSCDNLVFNGDFSEGIDGWQGFALGSWNISWGETDGIEGTGALKTTSRSDMHSHWIQQWLDSSCIEAGNMYRIELHYRNVDSSGASQLACQGNTNDCPRLKIATQQDWADVWHQPGEVGTTIMPYDTTEGAFNKITGQWSVTETEASANRFRMYIQHGTGDLIIDDVQIVKVSINDACSTNQIINGDAEGGTATKWYGWANAVGVESPGYGDSTYALKAYNRNRWVRGIHNNNMQDMACINEGDTWRATFKTKMYDQYTLAPIICTPSNNDNNCPMLRIHTMHEIDGATKHRFHIQRDTDMVWDSNGGWNTFDKTFTITASMVEDTRKLFRFMIVGGPADSVLVLDDIEFYLVPS